MTKRSSGWFLLPAVAFLVGAGMISARAQSSSGSVMIQDGRRNGTLASVVSGGTASTDSGVVVYAQGAAGAGSPASGNPVTISGVNVAGVTSYTHTVSTDASGAPYVVQRAPLFNETIVPVTSSASNGATRVVLLGAVAGQSIQPVFLILTNTDTVGHLVTLFDGATAMVTIPIGAAGASPNYTALLLTMDDLPGIRTTSGNSFGFSIDQSGGTLAGVTAQGRFVQRGGQ